MRFKPLHLTAALAIAFAGTSALAQTSARTTGSSPLGTVTATTSGTTTGTTSSTNRTSTTGTNAAIVGCAGSNGSTCSTSASGDTSGTGTTANGNTTTTGGGVTTSGPDSPGITGSSGSATPMITGGGGSAQGTNVQSNDPTASRPDAFAPGGNFSTGNLTSSGTTNGVDTIANPNTGTNTTNNTNVNGNGVVPGVAGTSAQLGTQQNVFVQPPQQPASGVTVLNTPIFDQAAREGRAKEQRRRASGNEPRVYGIAPRTDRDLTWQMPDDPIIRY